MVITHMMGLPPILLIYLLCLNNLRLSPALPQISSLMSSHSVTCARVLIVPIIGLFLFSQMKSNFSTSMLGFMGPMPGMPMAIVCGEVAVSCRIVRVKAGAIFTALRRGQATPRMAIPASGSSESVLF